MHVDPQALRAGANASDDAGGHADTGAQRLDLAGLTTGMFGDFEAANSFHTALGTAKDDHRDALHGHHDNLAGIAENVRAAAATFTSMDNRNAKLLRDVIAGTGQ